MSDRRERLDNPEEAALIAMEGLQSKIWTAIPGIVVSVDLVKQTVSVQPTIQGVTTGKDNEETNVNLPVLPDVPLVFPRAGGFALTFPVKPGDEVLVVFGARAIDSWWQSGGIGVPVESRMHDLSDGFAIPGPTSQPKKLPNVSPSNVQIRNESGTAYIEITPAGNINLVGATITTTASGAVTTTAGSSVTTNAAGPVAINAAAHNITAGSSTHNGKNIGANHTHINSGGNGTGGPPS